MMSRHEANVYLSAILTTLAETGGAKESSLYIAAGMQPMQWSTIRALLVAGNLVTIDENEVTLTAKGRDIAAKCAAVANGR